MLIESLTRAGVGPDSPGFWLLLAFFLAAAILFFRALALAGRIKRLREKLQETKLSLVSAEERATRLPKIEEQLDDVMADRSRLEMEISVANVRLKERERAMAEMKQRMETDFRAAASKMLGEAHNSFLERADETFKRHRESATVDADKRRNAIDELIKPMRDTLVRYETGLSEMRLQQEKTRGELVGRIGDLAKSANDVRIEAQKLSTSLRSGPKVRGRWGEEQLRNVVEMAGMAPYVDFVEQPSHDDGERRKQPDMVVSLPGARAIAIDSKVSINAYLDAMEAESDAIRQQHLEKHARDLWAHVKALASRDYAASLQDSLDFVVMFVPGENYFAAAMETRPQLFQDAFDKKILIATPTTLLAILKSASYGWRQEKAAENAQHVAAMAKELYDSLRTMGGHISGLGKSLTGAVKKYNDLLGGVEQRVMPRARKFAEYELPGIDEQIELPDVIENTPRDPRDDRDLLIPPNEKSGKSAA